MGRASVTVVDFALADGAPADTAAIIHVAPAADRFGRVLLASVEPLECSPRGAELAKVALHVLRDTFAATPGSCAIALAAAFDAANAAVIAENRPLITGRWERRICVGASAVALAGREIVVAQAAPSQAILVQDGQVYAFPDVASWRGDYAPEEPVLESHPLGFAEDEAPRFYHSEALPGDLVTLCSTSLGRVLARDERAVVDLYGGALLTGDLAGSVDRLQRLLAQHDVTEAFAVVASVSRLPARSRLRPRLTRVRESRTVIQRSGRVAADAGTHKNIQGITALNAELVAPVLPSSIAPPPLFEGFRDWAIDLAELFSGNRQQRAPAHQTRRSALAAPGALSVRRYRDTAGIPPEWRANLPRGPGVHLPVRFLAVSLLLFATLGGTGLAVDHQRDREARVESSLAAADVALSRALENPGTAMSSITEAETAVATARKSGATGDAVVRREQELARVRDQVLGILRLGDVVRIGALPADSGEELVRLALANETLYVAAGNLYEVDFKQGRLVALLSRGAALGGGSAGEIRHVSIDSGSLVASDGATTYRRDKAGNWQRQPLAVADVDGLRPDSPVVTWGDASYALSREGDLVRFDQASGGSFATTWAAVEDQPDLESARDFVIDGRIHVLLEDGRALTFSRGALMGTVSPFVVPALDGAAFLADAPFANALYIVDRKGTIGENTGRIVRVDADGKVRQYLTPAPVPGDLEGNAAATALAEVADLAIDELTGAVYWVSGGELWSATLPPA